MISFPFLIKSMSQREEVKVRGWGFTSTAFDKVTCAQRNAFVVVRKWIYVTILSHSYTHTHTHTHTHTLGLHPCENVACAAGEKCVVTEEYSVSCVCMSEDEVNNMLLHLPTSTSCQCLSDV